MPLNNLCGRATGIGSTPHPNPAAALDLIFTYFKEIPHWPQLPRRGAAEGLARQYLGPLLKHGLISPRPNGTPYFCLDDPGWEKRCLDYYELLLAGENALQSSEFAFMEESAAGFYAFLERCARQPPQSPMPERAGCRSDHGWFQGDRSCGEALLYDPSLREIIVNFGRGGMLAGAAVTGLDLRRSSLSMNRPSTIMAPPRR